MALLWMHTPLRIPPLPIDDQKLPIWGLPPEPALPVPPLRPRSYCLWRNLALAALGAVLALWHVLVVGRVYPQLAASGGFLVFLALGFQVGRVLGGPAGSRLLLGCVAALVAIAEDTQAGQTLGISPCN